MSSENSWTRRGFIRTTAVASGALLIADPLMAAERLMESEPIPDPVPETEPDNGPLIVSAPMLQNFAETTIGVSFAVSALANGYMLIGEQPDLSDARKVLCGGYRMTEISDRVIQVRVTGLKPATTYYYRIGADRIHYGGGYDMKVIGNEEDSRVYRFTTAGNRARGHFCVINDTHKHWETIGPLMDAIAQIKPSCVIWNGDASTTEEKIEDLIGIYLAPEIERKDYASETPYLFCPGNHDFRGMANRHLERVWMYRQPEERATRDWDLGRNFAVRLGDIALIGLDTAEDKLDTNPHFAGLFTSEPYRRAQTEWLKDALKQEEIAHAPYLVAFCHIPIFDDDPTHNPGDCFPDDKDPRYFADFAYWQRTCGKMWGPLLDEAGCQVLIAGHMHKFRVDAPGPGRGWTQVIGGGPRLREEDAATIIEGEARDGRLRLTVHNLFTGKIQETLEFRPR